MWLQYNTKLNYIKQDENFSQIKLLCEESLKIGYLGTEKFAAEQQLR